MAQTHWHIKVHGESHRETGALATTYEAAVEEQRIENEGNHSRRAKIQSCNEDCFGSRVA